MKHIGVERVHYFCPRQKTYFVIALYFTYEAGNKEYTLLECENEQNCDGILPNKKSIFSSEYCPAYKEYDIV
jgi:hypothetical protein